MAYDPFQYTMTAPCDAHYVEDVRVIFNRIRYLPEDDDATDLWDEFLERANPVFDLVEFLVRKYETESAMWKVERAQMERTVKASKKSLDDLEEKRRKEHELCKETIAKLEKTLEELRKKDKAAKSTTQNQAPQTQAPQNQAPLNQASQAQALNTLSNKRKRASTTTTVSERLHHLVSSG